MDAKGLDLFLGKVDGGRHLLSAGLPVLTRITGTRRYDLFEQPGEPICVKHLCEDGIRAATGLVLDPLEVRAVRLVLVVGKRVQPITVAELIEGKLIR